MARGLRQSVRQRAKRENREISLDCCDGTDEIIYRMMIYPHACIVRMRFEAAEKRRHRPARIGLSCAPRLLGKPVFFRFIGD
jgi:hypothetical protein